MKVLVVGGAGYIGSVVAKRLLDEGHQVTVFDNLSKGHRWAVPDGARLEVVDLLERDRVADLVAEPSYDGVLHFAALSLVGESVLEPARYFRTNVAGTVNLLDAMRGAGVPRLVFSSTAAVYGEPEEVPIVETAPTVPTNPYGASKLAVDQLIGYEAAAGDLGAVSLRYFNVAGASGLQGEVHSPETHLIPLVLQAASGQRPSVSIFGTDYPTPDGTAIRDYIHVEDLAAAHILALEAAQEPGHRVYNLGNGSGFSVREVLDAAREVTGLDIPAVEAARRSGDPAVLVASSDRIQAELGWKAEKPELEAMIADAWAFLQRQSG
ncbi:MAG: UDP-glucose 4-epimerase GalE [Actinobacteria bacterium]|nr:UDP-glucose 4-epimerase GalE [Actinomycetota bacterium]MBW3649758.1 UDP-glucose 4-epimerase GalE [Actinomycetota bacterium]